MFDHDKVLNELPGGKGRKVWCRTCHREQDMGTVNGLRDGWPKCCGYTMTIDPPEEWTD